MNKNENAWPGFLKSKREDTELNAGLEGITFTGPITKDTVTSQQMAKPVARTNMFQQLIAGEAQERFEQCFCADKAIKQVADKEMPAFVKRYESAKKDSQDEARGDKYYTNFTDYIADILDIHRLSTYYCLDISNDGTAQLIRNRFSCLESALTYLKEMLIRFEFLYQDVDLAEDELGIKLNDRSIKALNALSIRASNFLEGKDSHGISFIAAFDNLINSSIHSKDLPMLRSTEGESVYFDCGDTLYGRDHHDNILADVVQKGKMGQHVSMFKTAGYAMIDFMQKLNDQGTKANKAVVINSLTTAIDNTVNFFTDFIKVAKEFFGNMNLTVSYVSESEATVSTNVPQEQIDTINDLGSKSKEVSNE